MRFLLQSDNEERAHQLADYLSENGIENSLDVEKNQDWGSPDYNQASCKLWVIEEDQYENALKLLDTFDPAKVKKKPLSKVIPFPAATETVKDLPKQGFLTLYIILACCLLFFSSQMTTPKLPEKLPAIPLTPLFSSPVKNELLYDFPLTYELVDKLVKLYGVEALNTPENLPSLGKKLFREMQIQPFWQGLYEKIFNPTPPLFNAPLFEKIRQGEIWRIFTPILLHGDLLHLLFNMLWLYVLGKQIEEKIGGFRYIFFILITAAFTNTLQYLMTGPNFIGFSGVLCAMIAFARTRQRVTPWEGYQMQRSTYAFILAFVFGMLAIQLLVFFLEFFTKQTLPISIANTAHIAGLVLGYLLGRLNFFARQT